MHRYRFTGRCRPRLASWALTGIVLAGLGHAVATGRPRDAQNPILTVTVAGGERVTVQQLGDAAQVLRVTRYAEQGGVVRSFDVRATTYRLAAAYGHGAHVILVTGPNPTYIVCVVDLIKVSVIATFKVNLLRASPSGRYLAYAVPGPASARGVTDSKLMISDMWPDAVAGANGAHVPFVVYPAPGAQTTGTSEPMTPPEWLDDTQVAFAVAQNSGIGRPGMAVVCTDLRAGLARAKTAVRVLETDRVVDPAKVDSLNPEAVGVVVESIERVSGADGMVLRVRFGTAGAPLVPWIDVRMW